MKAVIGPGDQPIQFISTKNNRETRHILVAWVFDAADKYEPVLLPPVDKGAELFYEVGVTNQNRFKWVAK